MNIVMQIQMGEVEAGVGRTTTTHGSANAGAPSTKSPVSWCPALARMPPARQNSLACDTVALAFEWLCCRSSTQCLTQYVGILDFLVPILTLGQHTLGLVPVSGQFLDELKIGNITPSDFFFRLHICTSLSYRDDV